MQISDRVWSSVLLDFIIKLLLSKEPMTKTEFDSILVVVDRLTKWKTFILYKESSTAEDLIYVFFR